MQSRRAWLGGLAGVAGGVAWVVWVVLGERRPPCCPGGVENEFLAYEWWKLAAFLLIGLAAAWLVGAVADLPGWSRRGAGLVALGGALGAGGLALEAAGLVLDRPFPEIAALVVLFPVGTLLVGGGSLAGGRLPRPVAGSLVAGAALFFAGNGETRAMLLWCGLGVAWALCGGLLLRDAARG